MLHSLPGTTHHFLLEALAYAVGAQLYWRAARGAPLPASLTSRLTLVAGAILGALVGSKLLHVAEHLPAIFASRDLTLWIGGKSLLGGLLGGTLGVEVAKRAVRWTQPTGDAWVLPMGVGIVIGRIGCQLSGYWDLTYGTPTSLPWAWDYGDGLGRHPTALYEAVSVAVITASIRRCRAPAGARFAAFLFGYCVLRFGLEFIKPPFGTLGPGALPVASYAGLTAIQWTALAGTTYYGSLLRLRLRGPRLT